MRRQLPSTKSNIVKAFEFSLTGYVTEKDDQKEDEDDESDSDNESHTFHQGTALTLLTAYSW